ncbi:MAG: hypothetical protein K2X47_02405 [Bdellovibrionales bacterium]|nr:hypothetical protein [Bdellovibrionales bacterium]
MKEKVNQSKLRSVAKSASVRIRASAKEKASFLLQTANKKNLGRKIKFEDLFELALGLVTDKDIKLLQERSLTHEDRKELLRQRYIELRGPISKDNFVGFLLSADFPEFMKEQSGSFVCSEGTPPLVAHAG